MEKRQEISSTITVENESGVESCSWSHDGRFIAITAKSGNVYIYLTRLNILASASQLSANIAVLTSIKEVSPFIFLFLFVLPVLSFGMFQRYKI